MRVNILGMRELQAAADDCARELMEAEDPAAMAAGEPIMEKWRSLVPVLDGNYRDSLVVVWLGEQGAAIGQSWVPGLPRNEQPFIYARISEFGDSDRAAQPAARPAMVAARQAALDAGAEPLRSVIKGRRARRR